MKLKGLSEKDLIAEIRKEFRVSEKDLISGIGDDAAVIKVGEKQLVITKDLLIEDVHFRSASHPPFLLGRKSLSVNLSDIAAMGCAPRYALLGFGFPIGTETDWVEDFFSGLKDLVQEFNVLLVGGDITQSQKITVSVTVIGEGEQIVRRSGAMSGHLLFVSGFLGDAGQGLALMREGLSLGEDERSDFFLRAFFDPYPQVLLGKEISRLQLASAMIDTSDGLSVDLRHICEESVCGAEVFLEKVPVSPELRSVHEDPLDLALHGGEDYQLLFSVPPEKASSIALLQDRYRISHIGQIIPGDQIHAVAPEGARKVLAKRGYQHFS